MCDGCGHPVEWHGPYGCRGWHHHEGATYPAPCRCRLDDLEVTPCTA